MRAWGQIGHCNNNYILSLSKADFVPNGIDFGQEIGLGGYTPPYLAPTTAGVTILQGVNYASGGGGILNYTGKIFGGRINLDAQMDNFANTRQEIMTRIGDAAAKKLLKNALFSVTIGSNDFINNYLTPCVSKVEQQLVSPESFVGAMISRYRIQLMVDSTPIAMSLCSPQRRIPLSRLVSGCRVMFGSVIRIERLYSMGARKIVVANVGPIGCIPFQREINPSAGDGCVVFPNQVAQIFNSQLRGLVKELGANLLGSTFIYADVYRIVDDIIQNYSSYGFENANSACCHVGGRYGGLIPCGPTSKVCEDRSKYVFWDAYHPTDAANSIIAMRLIDGDSADIWPLNIRHLMGSPPLD
ncbi:hypothetical protein DH2020_004356 [Rehmannia glutinosa]|uniref:GDSL esterase/lipase n=1 Tax=Rehmannia glutinosa TaxID=99300 RepID=A0ABR0XP70_REHGL